MARIHELIRQLRMTNESLANDLEREFDVLSDRRAFGLNFERHTPEAVELPGRPVRTGDKVHILPPRGEKPTAANSQLWRVTAIERPGDERLATLEPIPEAGADQTTTADVADLVVVAEFRDPIYPGLVSTGKVERGGDKPFHTVINSENYHALQTLLFTHRGKVDAIYIDPPYNTGADDWQYNDRYIDTNDLYRHSKWLAFMERRLILAKELLAPTGVIGISIGDDEIGTLRLLCDQVFGSESRVAQVTVEMSTTQGMKVRAAQNGAIVKNSEYLLIYAGSSDQRTTGRSPLYDSVSGWPGNFTNWLNPDLTVKTLVEEVRRHKNLVQEFERITGSNNVRTSQFGVVYLASTAFREWVHENLSTIVATDKGSWPSGTPEPNWIPSQAYEYSSGTKDYLVMKSSTGSIRQLLRLSDNFRVADDYAGSFGRTVIRGDLWKGFYSDMAHVSLEGAMQFANGKKPIRLIENFVKWACSRDNAVVLDFFGGSGSTAHAVMSLNASDAGNRRSIVVTNNEVSRSEAARMREKGERPGDTLWEAYGVFNAATRPRIETVAQNEFEANVEFFTLTYEAPIRVQSHREFERIAPLLWLRAGSRGRRIESLPNGWDVADAYGVIADLDRTDEFLAALAANSSAQLAFIVTDEDRLFEAIVRDLPPDVEPVRLYASYLRNFEIDAMRGVR